MEYEKTYCSAEALKTGDILRIDTNAECIEIKNIDPKPKGTEIVVELTDGRFIEVTRTSYVIVYRKKAV
jgi:hypothetical protein